MKKLNIGLVFLAITSSMYAKNIVIDNLNETKHINISRTDINRFVFPAPIKTQVNSKEKDLMVTTSLRFDIHLPARQPPRPGGHSRSVGQYGALR